MRNARGAESWIGEDLDLEALSDDRVHQLMEYSGERTRHWRNCYAGLIPVAVRRDLPGKKGHGSILHQAAKQAGFTHEKTTEILRLARGLEAMPLP